MLCTFRQYVPSMNKIVSSIIIIILSTTSASLYLLFLPLFAIWTHLEGQLLYDFSFQWQEVNPAPESLAKHFSIPF